MIMEYRSNVLAATIERLHNTGIPLVIYDPKGFCLPGNGTEVSEYISSSLSPDGYGRAGIGDDPGIYYFVPKILDVFHLNLSQATNIFLYFLIIGGFLIGTVGFLRLFKSWPARSAAVLGMLFFARFAYKCSDVYVTSMFCVSIVIPWAILLEKRTVSHPWYLYFLACFWGLFLGYSNIVRSHSGDGMVLFLLIWIAMNRSFRIRQKLLVAAIFSVFFVIPWFHFRHLEKQRDFFLASKIPNYEASENTHDVWHTLYVGLGYLDNPYGIKPSDKLAYQKALAADPQISYFSNRYESIFRNATIDFVRSHPMFTLRTIAAKTNQLIDYVLVYANVGLLFLFYSRLPRSILFPMLAALMFYGLPGILAVPKTSYVMGLIGISIFIWILSIGSIFDQWFQKNGWKGTAAFKV